MRVAEHKRVGRPAKTSKAHHNGKRQSFRDLKAFGLWADRHDMDDTIEFTKRLRAQIDHGNDAR